MLTIRPVAEAELPRVHELAERVWRAHYPGIIAHAQIEYMLERMCSVEVMRREMTRLGIEYWAAFEGEQPVAYAAFGPEPDTDGFKLHKLYVGQAYQRRGTGGALIRQAVACARRHGHTTLTLNVNRHNHQALAAYRRHGFHVRATARFDIGGGFHLDDYIMERPLAGAECVFQQAREDHLALPAEIIFGVGSFARLTAVLPPIAPPDGDRPIMIVTDPRATRPSGRLRQLEDALTNGGWRWQVFDQITGEPDLEMARAGTDMARTIQPVAVLSLGGGSAMDIAKAVAALAVNEGDVLEYLETIGNGRQLARAPLPHVAIPTVAGTGAEMTKNAVIASHTHQSKRSMRDDRMYATLALIDPALTAGVPAPVTAAGGMDTITQLIESCITARRKPAVTALALNGLQGVKDALPRCYDRPDDEEARTVMSRASALSGICLANAGLAMAHGIAAALGERRHLAHGVICGILLPHTLRHNREAAAQPLREALSVFLGEKPGASTIDRGIEALAQLNARLGLPPDLRHLRLSSEDLDWLAANAGGTSMSGNPIPMTPERTHAFLASIA